MFTNGDYVMILGTSFRGTVTGRELTPGHEDRHPMYTVQLDTDSATYSAVFTVRADALERLD